MRLQFHESVVLELVTLVTVAPIPKPYPACTIKTKEDSM